MGYTPEFHDDIELRTRWHRLWPFLVATLVVVGVAIANIADLADVGYLCAAVAVFASVVLQVLAVPWDRVPRWTQTLPCLWFCLGVALLRQSGGVHAAGYGPMFLFPVVWQAMYGRRRDLAIVLGGAATVYAAPIFLLGGQRYPPGQWVLVTVSIVVATVVSQVMHALVAERTCLIERLAVLASRDELTGLLNRRDWDELIDRAAHQAARDNQPLSIALMDLDHFKIFNDTYGHATGDKLLQTAARNWERALRPQDVLVRWGGEEFALLLPATAEPEARVIIERLRDVTPLGQTLSAGLVTERPLAGLQLDLHGLVEEADVALYTAKRQGRNRTVTVSHLIDMVNDAYHGRTQLPERPAIPARRLPPPSRP